VWYFFYGNSVAVLWCGGVATKAIKIFCRAQNGAYKTSKYKRGS